MALDHVALATWLVFFLAGKLSLIFLFPTVELIRRFVAPSFSYPSVLGQLFQPPAVFPCYPGLDVVLTYNIFNHPLLH